jgi:immune inhibitor A
MKFRKQERNPGMTSQKRIFKTLVFCICLVVLLASIASAKTQSRGLREFLAAGNSADVCYINPAGEATVIKDIQAMPPSPELIDRLKKEGKLDEFLKQLSVSQKAVSSTGIPVNHTPKMMRAQSKGGNTLSAVTGTQRAIVLFVDFSDKTSKTNTTSFNTLLFGAGSSLSNFFQTVSYSKLSVAGTVAGWYRAPQTYQYYCYGKNGLDAPYPHNAQKLVEDALDLANASVNFAQYDTDGDSYVDALFVVHAGPGAEYSGSTNDIWSHAWGINSKLVDGVYVSSYSMEPEYWSVAGDMTIGVYCHELGHVFGLPDFYDTDNTSEGLGNWSLMAGGSWNGNNGNQPAFPDAWCRIYLGWVTPSTLRKDVNTVSIPSAETTAVVYKLWSKGTAVNEYFLVENRQKYSYDYRLPGGGLCIYHVDDGKSDNDSEWYPGYTAYGHYWIALEQADGQYSLESAVNNRGDGGDPYPGTTLKYNFNATTNPDSKSYSGTNVQVEVNNISSSSMIMTADMKIGILPTSVRYWELYDR